MKLTHVLLFSLFVYGQSVTANALTVEDVIETEQITADGEGAIAYANSDLASPSGDWMLVQTRRGDIDLDVVIDTLYLIPSRMSGQVASSFKPRVLANFTSSRRESAPAMIRWLSENRISLLAEGRNKKKQVYVVDTGGALEEVTQSSTDIQAYAWSGNNLLYYADVTEHIATSIDVGDRPFYDVVNYYNPRPSDVQLYAYDVNEKIPRKISKPMRIDASQQHIWLSPSGRKAVVLFPIERVEKSWRDYVFPGGWPAVEELETDSPARRYSYRFYTSYWIIDVSGGAARPLLDAPGGFMSGNRSVQKVLWGPNETSLIVSNTFLPVEGPQRELRQEHPAIVEVDLERNSIAPIMFEASVVSSARMNTIRIDFRLEDIEWYDPGKTIRVVTRRRDPPKTGKSFVDEARLFERRNGRWQQVLRQPHTSSSHQTVRVTQDWLKSAKLDLFDASCACFEEIFRPAGRLDGLSHANSKVIHWIDSNGITWRGGLLLPLNYQSDLRYPVVLQTHGFDEHAFLSDGPSGITSAMAALPLVSAGFAVLQIEDNAAAITLDENEGHNVAEGYFAAIQKLTRMGIADPERVGIIGFSRTAYHALSLISKYPQTITAAIFSDGLQRGFFSDIIHVNNPSSLAQVRRLSGGGPFDGDVGAWFARNPLYSLTNAKAAIRLEAYDPAGLVGMWETFALLRQANKPVEFFYFPFGDHNLWLPSERIKSQGGTVSWFRRWLLNNPKN